jgi:glucose/arabinose dehydrogenase
MNFGTDGKLYIAVGDNDNSANAQKLSNLKGKMLRINADGTIPQDNPFYDNEKAEGKDKAIWARGLRNPFSFAVHPVAGTIFINDVGEHKWEEINEGAKGANYGWPRYEGSASDSGYEDPVYAYQHGNTPDTGCAITGGAFYSPKTAQFPSEYQDDYFFADYCSGWIRRFDPVQKTAYSFKAISNESPVDLKTGDDGALYFLARGTGSVEKISYNTG